MSIPSQVPDTFQPLLEPLLGPFSGPLFYIGDTQVTIFSIATFLLILIIAFVASGFLRRMLRGAFRRRGIDEGVSYALNRLVHYVILALAVFLALENLGINVTGLAALGAVLGVGIGFGLQNIAQNFVSGLVLLLERPVKRGDFVVVGDTMGTVHEIRARATVVRTLDNVDILVPNSEFINENVINQTFGDKRFRARIAVGVAYGSDTERVRDTLLRLASEHPEVLGDPEPAVRFLDFGDSSLDFVLMVWIDNPRRQNPIASDLRFAIDRAFREAEIEIPFPQRDLHVRSGLEAVDG